MAVPMANRPQGGTPPWELPNIPMAFPMATPVAIPMAIHLASPMGWHSALGVTTYSCGYPDVCSYEYSCG